MSAEREEIEDCAQWVRDRYGWTVNVEIDGAVTIGGGDRLARTFMPLALMIFAANNGWRTVGNE